MSEEYYSLLARTIEAAGEDQAQLRGVVYQLARMELRTELSRRHATEMQEQISALENAITKVEYDVGDGTALLTFRPEEADQKSRIDSGGTGALDRSNPEQVLQPEILPPLVLQWPYDVNRSLLPSTAVGPASRFNVHPTKQIRATFWWNLQIVMATLVGVAIYVMIETKGDFRPLVNWFRFDQRPSSLLAAAAPSDQRIGGPLNAKTNILSAPPPSMPSPQATVDGIPLPHAYGVYAVDRKNLVNLGLLPIRVPDRRVGMSALISTPSDGTLSDGRLRFIAFRRDLINNAPDTVMVRVVARVMHALTFDAQGKATIKNIALSWAVRSNAYEMKVSPIAGQPEMILIEPAKADFSFPAGRYALVLPNAAYDFTVAGRITDAAHCLERTDALNMPVYNECRIP
jgi:hypothetical protein